MLALGTLKGGVVLHSTDSEANRKESAHYLHSKPVRRVGWINEVMLLTINDDNSAVVFDCKGKVSTYPQPLKELMMNSLRPRRSSLTCGKA